MNDQNQQNREYSIYSVINTENGKRYIGQTCQKLKKRWYIHCKTAKAGSTFYFHRAVRKYGEEKFQIELLEVCESLNIANEAEIWWIEHFCSTDDRFGYNICKGGSGTPGHKLSVEMKQKLSEMNKGKKLSEETKIKIGKAGIGRKHTEETKKKIGDLKRGKPSKGHKWSEDQRQKMKNLVRSPTSEETKLKQSLAKLGKKHSEETNSKQSARMKGHYVSKETGDKISEAKSFNFEKEMLVEKYKRLKQIKLVAEELDCCAGTVLKYLRLYGIK